MIDPKIAYNQLPKLFPKELDRLDTDILVKSLSTMQALASLNSMIQVDKNSVSHVLNMMSPLYVPEAVASSGVEEIITTNESVYMQRAMESGGTSHAEKEVMRYTEALAKGYTSLNKNGFISTNEYIEIQKKLEPSKSGLRRSPGTNLINPKTNTIYYTPPDNEKTIRDLLMNFEEIFNEEAPKHEVLIRAAVLHYQFEAIHPFHDGNGRTGRILIPLYLTGQNLLGAPLLFTSKYILENRDEYYKRLRNVTFAKEWKEWVLYILDALDTQSRYTLDVLTKLDKFNKNLESKIKKHINESKAGKITRLIYDNPYFTQALFESVVEVSSATARKYLSELESLSVIVRRKQPKRNRYLYACPEYIKLMKSV